ncbi:MAG TPA: hypothetical protein VGO97_03250 [Solirubrobacterales bacterium]|nr:hypothetical protein [Solirubrobacterales bacterium]
MSTLPEAKIEALRLLPGAKLLIDAVADEQGVYLVGGAVRDLMLGFAQFDFDLTYEGDATQLAERLADRLGGTFKSHQRFGTATVRSADDVLIVDIAGTRSETYERPGALPTVEPADLGTDLRRRDFTVNALAVALWADRFGDLIEFDGASADLAARMLRVTHEDSFIDDPTRLLRLLRYGARLGFTAEPHTEDLARAAVEGGAPSTVSGPRIADELMDLLAERSAVVAVDSMYALGLDSALHPDFHADEYVASRALLRLADGLRQDLLLLAVCSREMDEVTVEGWIDHLGLEQPDRSVVREAVLRHPEAIERLEGASSPSEIDSALRPFAPETIALAAALPSTPAVSRDAALDWLDTRRDDHLLIGGADLRTAGVPEGPEIGRALAETMARAIDGELTARDSQLEYAVTVAKSLHAER